MSNIDAANEKDVPAVDEDAKFASEDLSDLEYDNTSMGTRAGSLYTIIESQALANLSDGYQNSLASSTNVVFNHLLGKKIYTSNIQTRISNALLVEAVIEIIIIRYTSDRFSRKGGMWVTSGLVVVGSLLSTLAFQVKDNHNMLWFLTTARGIAGVGIGGGYPTSAAAALEGSNERFDNQRGPNSGSHFDFDGNFWRVDLYFRLPSFTTGFFK